MTDKTYTVDFTEDEIEVLLQSLAYVNAYCGIPPWQPTPGMSAAAKLGIIIDRERTTA